MRKLEKKVAVIDLGTNVFNLLLANFSSSGCVYIKDFKYPSLIGAGGLSKGIISKEAFNTANEAFVHIMHEVELSGGVDEIIPYATSAIRDATNCNEFVEYFDKKFGINISVISGEQEAEFVFRGIKASLKGSSLVGNMLFLDIGGGSNEFIITDGDKILWKRSFPIGMARMREKFAYNEPLPFSVRQDFCDYCINSLQELWVEAKKYKPKVLVGSSGSFDTFRDLMFNCIDSGVSAVELPYEELKALNNRLEHSLVDERLKMNGMSSIRVDYIVLASVFVQLLLSKLDIRSVYQSSYSLKEGAMDIIYESYNKLNI